MTLTCEGRWARVFHLIGARESLSSPVSFFPSPAFSFIDLYYRLVSDIVISPLLGLFSF